ncbi:MAG: L,D-transpeptidase family protein [Sulfobacillus thermotolerans]|nr:L,D-transpeptidase family protein [Sulfobacillus thermotolerans]
METRSGKHRPHRWGTYLWPLPFLAAGLAAYAIWPRVSFGASSRALARITVTGHVLMADAVNAHGQAIPLVIKNGQLWPSRSLHAGSVYDVRIAVQGPSWWPFGPVTVTHTVTTPTDPILASNHLIVSPGKPLSLSLSAPASSIRIMASGRISEVTAPVPQQVYSINSLGTVPGQQGTLTVETQARAWESVSMPKTLSWRTPGWLKVTTSPSVYHPIGLYTPLLLSFSQPIANPRITPRLSPSIPGHWIWKNNQTEEFIPNSSTWGYGPNAVINVTLPGGKNGYIATDGAYFPKTLSVNWATAPGSTLRLQELLAKLGYLPLKWIPSTPVAPTLPAQIAAMETAPSGQFQWEYAQTPAALQSLWVPGQYNVMVKGAVMNFERVEGMPTDGVAGPAVWKALINADLADQTNPDGYTYAYVSENLPETLTLWHNGQIILKTLANTGIPQSPTYLGTYPVYLRYRSQTMQGVNPFGVKYYDPGVPYINYFKGGDAVHGFPRASYGFPQSLGCVELPIPVAARVWPYMHYGTLVTVAPPTKSAS